MRSFVTSTLLVLATVTCHSHAAKEFEQKILDAFNIVDSDPDAFKSVWADDCEFKVCFKGTPGCSEGNYDEVFGPFLSALKVCKLKSEFVSAVDDKATLMKSSAYLETKLGCSALYTSLSYNEINDEGKVIKHMAYSEDSEDLMACVEEYFASLEEKKKRTRFSIINSCYFGRYLGFTVRATREHVDVFSQRSLHLLGS